MNSYLYLKEIWPGFRPLINMALACSPSAKKVATELTYSFDILEMCKNPLESLQKSFPKCTVSMDFPDLNMVAPDVQDYNGYITMVFRTLCVCFQFPLVSHTDIFL
jgi:hypothetical protein